MDKLGPADEGLIEHRREIFGELDLCKEFRDWSLWIKNRGVADVLRFWRVDFSDVL